MLDQKYLLELFEYKDGELYWKISPSNNTAIGSKAGTKKAQYTKIGINGVRYYAHKIIFMMIHGYCPKLITFIDGNRQNCKIENLQEITSSQLIAKVSRRIDNTSGYKGVSWSSKNKNWVATITKNGKMDKQENQHYMICLINMI
jgi:hypothetical protein